PLTQPPYGCVSGSGTPLHVNVVAVSPAPLSKVNSPPLGNGVALALTTAPMNGLMSDGTPLARPTPSCPLMNRVIEAARPKPIGPAVALPTRRPPSVTTTPMRTVAPGKFRVVVVGRSAQVGAIHRIEGWS